MMTIDDRPPPPREPIEVAGELVRRGGRVDVEAARVIRDLADEIERLLEELQETTARADVSEIGRRESRELLALVNEGLPMDESLWAMMKQERDDGRKEIERLRASIATEKRMRKDSDDQAEQLRGELLRKELSSAAPNGHDYREGVHLPVCRQCEIARLRAIVDKLPKTADGVPVVPGMNLWFWCPYTGKLIDDKVFQDSPEIGGMSIAINRCYSTREAADAAEAAGDK